MKVRFATQADSESIADIQVESWRDTYSANLPADYLAGPIADDLRNHWNEWDVNADDVVLVVEDERILGFIAIWCRPDPFVDNLHARPYHRSAGLGAKLLQTAFRELVERGHETAYLWVVESNVAAIRFYERLGGSITERALKNLLGHDVPNLKIQWSKLKDLPKSS